ncbi:titin-like isoform X2 [Tubulanus polymorphus]|uniref:titin-like isoform X2 n=1 Tax=Tubulanus polymorphus TaxID=672921 RepID=UPI003DA1DB10
MVQPKWTPPPPSPQKELVKPKWTPPPQSPVVAPPWAKSPDKQVPPPKWQPVAPPVVAAAPRWKPTSPEPHYTTEFSKQIEPRFQQVDVTIAVPVPPKFIEPLKNIAAEEGSRVVFDGVISGKPEPTIKWFREGREISDKADFEISYKQGRVSLTIPEVFEEDAGLFMCGAENIAGHATSSAELIVKATMIPPSFPQRLQSQEVKEGKPVRLTVQVAGAPIPDVTWYREGQKIISSPDFEIVQEGDVHSLYIPEVFYEDSGKFTVAAENPAGRAQCTAELIVEAPSGRESMSPSPPRTPSERESSVEQRKSEYLYAPDTSKFAPRRMYQQSRTMRMSASSSPEHSPTRIPFSVPTFTRPLQNTYIREGQRVTLECEVRAHPQPVIRWYREDVEIKASPDYMITYDLGISRLVIAEAFEQDAGKFTCTATNNLGTKSSFCHLRVDRAPELHTPPEHAEPQKSFIPENAMPPTFIRKPQHYRLLEAASAFFDCKVAGYPAPDIVWSRAGRPLKDGHRFKMYYDKNTGEISLVINMCLADDEGEFTCTAINPVGETSETVFLMGEDRYRQWLAAEEAARDRDQEKERQKVLLSELETRLESPRQRKETFFTPRAERRLEQSIQRRISEDESRMSQPRGDFVVSTFEQRLMKEIEFREEQTRMSESESERYDSEPLRPKSVPVSGPPDAPHLVQKLKNFKLIEGSDVTFVCKVTGVPRPQIQWYKNGIYIQPSQRFVQRYTHDGYCTLRIRIALKEDAGHYTVFAINPYGKQTCSAELYIEGQSIVDDSSFVSPETMRSIQRQESQKSLKSEPGSSETVEKHFKPVFKRVPSDQEAREGNMVRFDCIVFARPMPELLWFRNGVEIHDDSLHKICVNEDGVHSLIFNAVGREDAGTYTCIARNKAGEDRFTVNLNVLEREKVMPPRFIDRIQNATVPEGQPVSFHCQAVGTPIPMMSWQKEGRTIIPEMGYRVVTEGSHSTLYIDQTRGTDNAWIQCTAVNVAGTASTRARLVVQCQAPEPEPERKLIIPKSTKPSDQPDYTPLRDALARGEEPPAEDMYDKTKQRPPKFRRKLVDLPNLDESDPAHLETSLVPIGDPNMKVEWYKDGKLLHHGTRFKTSWDFSYIALDLLWTYPEDDGEYYCHASNLYGEDWTNKATLKCKPKKGVITETQLPDGMESVRKLDSMEKSWLAPMPDMSQEEEKPPQPPAIDLKPEPVVVDEGEPAKFLVKVSGHPRPRVVWWINGSIIASGTRFKLSYDGMMHYLEIPKCREYDAGQIRVTAKNKSGEAFASTDLEVQSKEDWRSRLKRTPKAEFVPALEKMKRVEARTTELDIALKKPKTSVFELRKLEMNVESRARTVQDADLKQQTREIIVRTSELEHIPPTLEIRQQSPTFETEAEVQVERARAKLQLDNVEKAEETAQLKFDKLERKEPPLFIRRLEPVIVTEGKSVKLEVEVIGKPEPTVKWYREGMEIQPSRDFQISTQKNSTSLFMPEIFPEDAGTYSVIAENPSGVAQTKAKITVIEELPLEKEQPPEFRSLLQDTVIKVGEPLTFDCQITGKPSPDVYWQKNGKRLNENPRWKFIVEDNHYTFLIYEVRPEDAGVYECVAIAPSGKTSCTAKLNVEGTPSKKPEPTTVKFKKVEELQVTPQCLEPLKNLSAVDEGNQAVFTCKISGTPRPVVTWYYGNQPIKQSKYFKMMSIGDTHTLTITQAFPEDAGQYKAIGVNPSGEVTSTATLKVNAAPVKEPEPVEPPRFLKPLATTELKEGMPVQLETVVIGQPAPEIQWLREGEPIKPSTDYQMYKDGDKHTLVIQEAFPEDSGIYTCRAVNSGGFAECASELFVEPVEEVGPVDVTIDVTDAPVTVETVAQGITITTEDIKPKFIQPLKDLDIDEGKPALFECQVIASPQPEITWLLDGEALTDTAIYTMVYEDGVCKMTIQETFPEDEGQYTCQAVNTIGQDTTSCELYIREKPKEVVEETVEVSLKPTEETPVQQVEAEITLTPAPEKKPEEQPPEEISITADLVTSDFTSPAQTAPEEVGAELTVPLFTKPLEETTPVHDGDEVTLECVVEGKPKPKVSWYHEKEKIQPSTDFVIDYDDNNLATLTIKEVYPDDAGIYTAEAVNEAGTTKSTTELIVEGAISDEEGIAPSFIVKPKFQTADEGSTCTFECKLIASPEPHITWSKDGVNVTGIDSSRMSVDVTADVHMYIVRFTIENVRPEDEGPYRITVSNTEGDVSTSASLTVNVSEDVDQRKTLTKKVKTRVGVQHGLNQMDFRHMLKPCNDRYQFYSIQEEEATLTIKGESPVFVQKLTDTSVIIGKTITLTCKVKGSPKPTITILKDDQEVSGPHYKIDFTDDGIVQLTIDNCTGDDEGDYMIKATNDKGTAETTCELLVNEPPKFTKELCDITVLLKDTGIFECTLSGVPEPTVTWYVSGIEIKETEKYHIIHKDELCSLEIHDVTPEDGDIEYTCKAVNTAGETSTTAKLITKGVF